MTKQTRVDGPSAPPEATPQEMMADLTAHLRTADPAAQQVQTYGVPDLPYTGSAVRSSQLDFDTLWNDDTAPEHVGFDLAKSKLPLVGFPFAIIGVTYRDGVRQGDRLTNYVSVEIVTASVGLLAARVRAGFLPPDTPIPPNATLIFNDGSTGIARQITQFLHDTGVIDVGEVTEETGGGMGQSPFDRYCDDWRSGAKLAKTGIRSFPLMKCPRGLRLSTYTNEQLNTDASTYYLG